MYFIDSGCRKYLEACWQLLFLLCSYVTSAADGVMRFPSTRLFSHLFFPRVNSRGYNTVQK